MMANNTETTQKKVSICIPAYKQKDLLARCLNSLTQQSFTNFEVIVTDDTPDNSIADFIKKFDTIFPLHYFKNEPLLGSPANWNEGLRKASGKYIKIMHHDDWFATNDALQKFVDILDSNDDCIFAFSLCADVVKGKKMPAREGVKQSLEQWKQDKSLILTYNLVGDPSTTIFRNGLNIWFDEKMKWCVDYDFYLQVFEKNKNILLIDEVLLNIGVHEGQVTNTVINDASVVVYESIRLVSKHKFDKPTLKQFDFFWRMMRNYKIDSLEKLATIARDEKPAIFLEKIVKLQKNIPAVFLRTGIFSKFSMLVGFLTK